MKPVALACLAVLLLIACSDQQPLQPPAGSRPSALIMDGAHHGGNADFFFLPPLAADPTGGPNFDPGKFNPNLAPTAEVCRLTGNPASGAVDCATDNLGRPVLVFGPKPMPPAAEQYQVTWDTKSPVLDASKFYRIIVRGAPQGTKLGLLDVDPVTGGMKNVKTGDVVQFQDGRSLPIKVRIEQGAFGATNPDHVEQVVPNHITTPTGTLDVTTNTGFAGARLVDNWLPAAAVAAGIDRVVVIIERLPAHNDVPATSCLKSGFKELEGCYRFRTDPDLHQYGPFNTTSENPVIAGVCFEQPIRTGAPYEMFRREETGEQELEALEDIDAPFLNCATFSRTPPTSVGVSHGSRSGRLLGLASGLRALMNQIGRALTPRPLNAVDLGAGGATKRFSLFGWARRATMTKAPPSDNQVTLVGTKVLTNPTVCVISLHPAARPLAGEPVTFTVSGGGGTVGGGTSALRLTGSDGCASAPWVLGSVPAANRLTAAAAASPGTVEFTATGVSVQVDAGGFHSCALNASGQVFCWGSNSFGQLGDGTTAQQLIPTPVAGGLTFATLSAGGTLIPEHTCGVTPSGAAYCWGDNSSGQLGDGTNIGQLVPTPVAGGLSFAAVSAGAAHTCGVTTSNVAYCWGSDGTTTPRLVPTPVTGGLSFAAVSAGLLYTCGVTTSGAAYCWGLNDNGQLGDGTTSQRLVPTPVTGGLSFAAVSAGFDHTCGVTTSGAAYCWGINGGRLGDGTTTQRLVPTPVTGGLTFATLSAGLGHTCGVSTSGAAYCWGGGILGDGTTTTRLVPTLVAGGLSFAGVSAGQFHTCGVTTSGAAYCWGPNSFGQLGDGTTITRLVPTAVPFAGNGAGVVRLTTSPGFDGEPDWSPDGTKIAFASGRDDRSGEIYVMNADGSGAVRLTTSAGDDLYPAWSPDGAKIAFVSIRDDPDGEIYVMNADGSGVVRLTTSAGGDVLPAWSPDGAKIAFGSGRDDPTGGIYVMNADGSGVVRLTTGGEVFSAWSPDGTKIAFVSTRDGDFEIYVMNADGTGVVRLTTSAGNDSWPTWSPDGAKIAFQSTRDGVVGIYVMNADGTGVVRLSTSTGVEFSPAWSPDGTKIAFVSTRHDPSGDIYVMPVAGAGPAQLTAQRSAQPSPR